MVSASTRQGRQRVKGGGSLLCGARGARGFLGGNWKVRGCLFLSTTLNLGTLKPPMARHAKCYDLFGPYAVWYNDNGAPDWMQLDVCMRIMASGQQPALGGE